jgi:hypothetical protein
LPLNHPWTILAALGILGFAAAMIRRRRGIARRPIAAASGSLPWAARLGLAAALVGCLLAASCDGGGVNFIHRPGTAPGTYTLMLTATSGNQSSSTPVTLTVTK